MAKYKLSITYELGEISDDKVNSHVHQSILVDLPGNPQIALLRDNDRSGANLLAPINDKHYKHGKISLQEHIERISNAQSES